MKRVLTAAAVLMFALTSTALAQQQPSPVQPAPVKRTMLGKVEVPGANYDVITAMVEIAPGFKAGRHTHPGTAQFQMVEGEFWLAVDGQPEKVFKAGEFGEIRDAAIHNEGSVGSGPAKLLVIYTVERGKPMVNPVK